MTAVNRNRDPEPLFLHGSSFSYEKNGKVGTPGASAGVYSQLIVSSGLFEKRLQINLLKML
jgi:hypothetical protein